MSKFSFVRKIINLIGSKAGHILLDERCFLLIISCLRSECNFIKDFSAMLQYTDDFNRVCMTYNVNALNNINEFKFNFWSYMNIMQMTMKTS